MTTKSLATLPTEDALAALRSDYPVEMGYSKIRLPRISMTSQDKTEGKGKTLTVVEEAGTFFTEVETEELNEEGKRVWDKNDIGTGMEAIILFQRKQLRMYDESAKVYTSSPIFDLDTEVVPLFCQKAEVARGTPAELKAMYEYEEKGKKKSALEDNRVLYVLYNDEVYQMTLRGSSMYAFLKYSRSVLPPAVLTVFSSESRENGAIAWNQMTFKAKRPLNAEEVEDISTRIKDIKDAITGEKAQYATVETQKNDFGGL